MDVIAVHYAADVVSVVIGALSLAVLAFILKEDGRGSGAEISAANLEITTVKVNYLKAIVPVIPILILILGATKTVAAFAKVSIPAAMLIGALFGVLASLTDTKLNKQYMEKVSKAFFDGMGNAYAKDVYKRQVYTAVRCLDTILNKNLPIFNTSRQKPPFRGKGLTGALIPAANF